MNYYIEINSCYNCPFFKNSMNEIECNHIYWNDKNSYSNKIITQNNKNIIPKKCPLLLKTITITYCIPKTAIVEK